ncbi:MAG: RNA polymerase sigma factor, partial [Planctomycetota bacterium]|nr:RNA polymerase sigma factor [Planctomycetota bacterium]
MDSEGYRRALDAHKDRVYGYALRMLGNTAEAEDVAQEALVRLWRHRKKVDGLDAARAWLLRTAQNLCFDRLRQRRTRPQAVLDEERPGLTLAPDRAAHSGELAKEIGRALERLSHRDRSLVVMREIEGMSYGEIASSLEMPLGTVKATLHRAREKLRKTLISG